MNVLADASFNVPVEWVLTGLLALCGTIAAMGKLIYSMCIFRIKALEKEVSRMSQGCGAQLCYWRNQHQIKQPNESE